MKRSWIQLKSIHLLSKRNHHHRFDFGVQTGRYLFLISKLVIYWRLLRRLDLDLLCGRPVRGVTVGQVAHSRVCKLGLFMSVGKKTAPGLIWIWTACRVENVNTLCLGLWTKKMKNEDWPVNNQRSDEDQDCQDGQNSTNHVADMKSFSFNRWHRYEGLNPEALLNRTIQTSLKSTAVWCLTQFQFQVQRQFLKHLA